MTSYFGNHAYFCHVPSTLLTFSRFRVLQYNFWGGVTLLWGVRIAGIIFFNQRGCSFFFLRHQPSGLNASSWAVAPSRMRTQGLVLDRRREQAKQLPESSLSSTNDQPSPESPWVLSRMMAKQEFRKTTLFMFFKLYPKFLKVSLPSLFDFRRG